MAISEAFNWHVLTLNIYFTIHFIAWIKTLIAFSDRLKHPRIIFKLNGIRSNYYKHKTAKKWQCHFLRTTKLVLHTLNGVVDKDIKKCCIEMRSGDIIIFSQKESQIRETAL